MAKCPRLTWRRRPRITGLAGVGQQDPGSVLHSGGVEYAGTFVSRVDNAKNERWHWVASKNDEFGIAYRNTVADGLPATTEDDAKAAAAAYVKSHFK